MLFKTGLHGCEFLCFKLRNYYFVKADVLQLSDALLVYVFVIIPQIITDVVVLSHKLRFTGLKLLFGLGR